MIGFSDFGAPADSAVLWCHGGPGSRLEPAYLEADGRALRLRLIGIDRPGYGLSPPLPGRTIQDWVSQALAVADRLGITEFVTVGESTALAPERVVGVVASYLLVG